MRRLVANVTGASPLTLHRMKRPSFLILRGVLGDREPVVLSKGTSICWGSLASRCFVPLFSPLHIQTRDMAAVLLFPASRF